MYHKSLHGGTKQGEVRVWKKGDLFKTVELGAWTRGNHTENGGKRRDCKIEVGTPTSKGVPVQELSHE